MKCCAVRLVTSGSATLFLVEVRERARWSSRLLVLCAEASGVRSVRGRAMVLGVLRDAAGFYVLFGLVCALSLVVLRVKGGGAQVATSCRQERERVRNEDRLGVRCS